MTKKSISEYAHVADSVSLKSIDGKPFTIVSVEDSNYEDNGKMTPGVKITTKERFEVDGKEVNKFHTTRTAIVTKLTMTGLRQDLQKGDTVGPVICRLQKPTKGTKDYWALVEA